MKKNALTQSMTAAALVAAAIAAAVAPVTVSAAALLGPELASFSTLAGGYATYGAGALVSGQVGAVTYVVGGAGSSSGGDVVNTATVATALSQIATAQSALKAMTTDVILLPTLSGNVTLIPGVYGATALTTAAGSILTLDGGGANNPIWVFNIPTYLVTGASTEIKIINAGAGASVLWNTGGYTTLGASTNFLGTILAGTYISQGAGSTMACGNTFALSYISIPAGANVTSSHCAGSGSWAGSVNGMGTGLDIVNGAAVASVMSVPGGGMSDLVVSGVPEPETYALLLAGLGVLAFKVRRNKLSNKRRDQV